MTTMLAVRFNPRIGRRSELGPDDGTMLRRRLIRSDEAWHDALTTSSGRSTSVADRLERVAIEIARESLVVIDQNLVLEHACFLLGDCETTAVGAAGAGSHGYAARG
jgi:hypothetical protein